MPIKVDPFDYLMAALSSLTNGLINDLKTLILGLVVCSFIVMALDLLKDLVLVPFFANPMAALSKLRQSYHDFRLRHLPATSFSSPNASARTEIEISPLRHYELDVAYRGVDALPDPPSHAQRENNWERDGVELSEDRYQELEQAMFTAKDEAEYEERMQHRMSAEEVDSMFARLR